MRLFWNFSIFSKFKTDENIEEIKMAKNSITTTSLAILTPAIIITKLAK